MDITEAIEATGSQVGIQPCRVRPVTGWPLGHLCELEDAGAHGLLACLARASVVHRQSVFLALASNLMDEPERYIEAMTGAPARATSWTGFLREAGTLLATTPARTIVRSVKPSAPRGLLGALARVGPDPLDLPESYERLVRFLATAPGHRRQVLAHAGVIDDLRLKVAEFLDEALLPVASRIKTEERLIQINDIAAMLHEFTSLTDVEITKALSDTRASTPLAEVLKRLLMRLEGFQAPFRPDPSLARLITSGDDLRRMGLKFRNCLGERHVVEAASGKTVFFEWLGEPGAIVEVHGMGEFYVLGRIHGAANQSPPVDLREAVRVEFRRLAPQVLVPSETPEPFQAAKRLFRHYPFEGFDLDELVEG